MRGDWIHDWVQVELDYRAGEPPAPLVRAAKERRPGKSRWAGWLRPRRVRVRQA
ncbi:hypothetical protein [Amycolatopsis sp. CA-128772]|uniref:hypothetical protein n=1 Tax=Amycolatopsis sp. CA-128772 TaxID=2073159 RepID=UPI0018EC978D|nr:hypothetical protein [Amycolatopsis sp. CA-128772]